MVMKTNSNKDVNKMVIGMSFAKYSTQNVHEKSICVIHDVFQLQVCILFFRSASCVERS